MNEFRKKFIDEYLEDMIRVLGEIAKRLESAKFEF
mgnify:CR=1 FL=1